MSDLSGIRSALLRVGRRIEANGPNIGLPLTRAMGEGFFEIRAKGKEGGWTFPFLYTGWKEGCYPKQFHQEDLENATARARESKDQNEGGQIMKIFKQMADDWMEDPEFREEYDALEEEYQYYDELIKARKRAGMTQEQIAQKMGTKREAVTRIESLRGRTSPSMNTLKKYAEAVCCKLQIKLVPMEGTVH